MNRSRQCPAAFAALLALSLLLNAGLAGAETRMVPKVDNFILYADQSGSMSMPSAKSAEYKMATEKAFLLKLNEAIPNLEYQGAALFTFGLFKQLSPASGVARYDRAAFRSAIEGLETDYPIYGDMTPMGDGLTSMSPVVVPMAQRLAVIILSDGLSNRGSDPVTVAKGYYDTYPGNICFHVVSFADEPKGQQILDNIAALSPCTVRASGSMLLEDQAAFDAFVRDVFFDMQEIAAAPAKVAPAKAAAVEETIVLRSINFDLDKSDIRPDMEPILNEAVAMIKSKNRPVQLGGHTCSLGADEYNQGLSQRRADAVRAYMVKKGVAPSSISAMGYGESKPKFDNAKEESRKFNRRVEISFK